MERRAAGFDACKQQAEALLEDADAQAFTARRGAAEAEAERARAQRTTVALMQQRDSATALAGRAAGWELEVLEQQEQMQVVVERAARLRSELDFERDKCLMETATLRDELSMCRTELQMQDDFDDANGGLALRSPQR